MKYPDQPKTFGCHHNMPTCGLCHEMVQSWKRNPANWITPADLLFFAKFSRPAVKSRVTPADFGASKPVIEHSGYQPDLHEGYSAQRAAFQELLQKTRRESDEMRERMLLAVLGMTAEEAVANRHRISRHCHPGQDVFLLDGEPLVAIHAPVIRGDELVTTYQMLRKQP